jgi:hypothetical protein|tara:strand:- start:22 stop:357 length:336 start_codon:yes stop_codon:yes gene_type:complete
MKKFVMFVIVMQALLWFGLSSIAKANTNDYNTAVIGHIISQKMQGVNVDTSVLEFEMQKLIYNYTLEMTNVLQKHLPSILDSLSAQIRVMSDSEYKCALLKDSKIKDKECN